MLAGDETNSWRRRTLLIAAVYLAYFVTVVVSLVVAAVDADAVRPVLIVLITVGALHFATSLYAMVVQPGGRASINSDMQPLVVVADWLNAAAIGVAADAVNRECGSQFPSALVAGVLLCMTQSVCALKTRHFLSPSAYDQDSGEKL